QEQSAWLRHSIGLKGCSASGTQAAAGGLAEVGAPDVVVGLREGGAQAFSPDDVVGRIDDAVLVVVAGDAGTRNRKNAGGVKLTRIPRESAGERGKLQRCKRAAQRGPIQNIERVT